MEERTVFIHTDGACRGNPGPGGYAAILRYASHEKELAEGYFLTTNNRMELLAVIASLEALTRPCKVELKSDSQYVVDSVSKGWVYGWRNRGWTKSNGDPALNVDLWQRLLPLLEVHKVDFKWIRGHADDAYNNRCDELAVRASGNPKHRDVVYEAENGPDRPSLF